ncbi:MAG TPA: toll/interleukin-1 receptor domain-containing protein [Nannocystis exedens]|nr:toll/interleukin-1 receptor domain-containing protein [Nannocystis exedens]
MSAPRPEKALYDLLCDLFDGPELVRFVTHTYGKKLGRDLPGAGSRLSDLAFAVTGLLDRRGLIQAELFRALATHARDIHANDKQPAIAQAARAYGFDVDPLIITTTVATATTTTASANSSSPLSGDKPAKPSPPSSEPTSAESWHVFISYAHADQEWVKILAGNLHRLGLDVFFDKWEIDAGTVVSLRLGQGLQGSRSGILVVSKTSISRPWVLQEYAVLLQKATESGQRLIPVLLEDAAMPAMLATRCWVDFRGKRGQDYLDAVQELAAAIRDEPLAANKRPTRGSPLQTP